MLLTPLIHPEILQTLAQAGHGSKILIADGHYPLRSHTYPGATRVYLNLRPGVVDTTTILASLAEVIVVEAAKIMQSPEAEEFEIYGKFRQLLPALSLQAVERFPFYELAQGPDVVLAIASGDQRIYANILLTIGVAPSA